MNKDWDTPEQCDMFDDYLEVSADINDRVKWNNAYGYAECEWEAFQYGWNAAKQHFGLTDEQKIK